MSTTAPREPDIRPTTLTRAQRRVAKAPVLAPGGPPTVRARIANQVIRVAMKSAWQKSPETDAGLIQMRRATERMTRLQTVPRGVVIEPQDLGDCTAEWVRAGAAESAGKGGVVLYLHGGGYFFGGPRLYRSFNWRLSAVTDLPVLALDYRLAPEHTPADALDDALTAYEFLLGDGYGPDDIVVGGDSAGGHLTLALLFALKERGRPLPRAAVVLSPWADLLCTAGSHTLNARTDSLIPAAKLAWLGRRFCAGKDDGDALHGPVRGDYAGLPPLMVIASDSEILRDDARQVAERARTAGVQVEHQEWAGLVHVFPVFSDFIPEGRAAFRHMAEFIRSAGS
jgi:acetyl esterase/lipase